MGSVLFTFSSLCTGSESLSDKQDKIQPQMFQNIATTETMLFSVCSESDTPDVGHLAWHRNGKAQLLFKEDSIIFSRIGSTFEISQSLMNNYHQVQKKNFSASEKRQRGLPSTMWLCCCCILARTPRLHQLLVSTLGYLPLHHSGS